MAGIQSAQLAESGAVAGSIQGSGVSMGEQPAAMSEPEAEAHSGHESESQDSDKATSEPGKPTSSPSPKRRVSKKRRCKAKQVIDGTQASP